MLIVTIPKSAGTALMETLARAQGIPCTMHYRWDGPRSAAFPTFHIQHNFDRELAPGDVAVMTAPGMIYKTHVVPSENNLALLRDHPKVILLRDAQGVVGAYMRGAETGVYPQKTRHFESCRTLEDWLSRARELGLLQEREAYEARWRAAPGNQLILDCAALIADPGREIARVESYFGLLASGTTTLLRRKYTRAGPHFLAGRGLRADQPARSADRPAKWFWEDRRDPLTVWHPTHRLFTEMLHWAGFRDVVALTPIMAFPVKPHQGLTNSAYFRATRGEVVDPVLARQTCLQY